jgi:RimJ/RimL family protein N-acetyltransferase
MNPAVAIGAPLAARYPTGLIQPVWLADGRRVLVRPVLPQDRDAEQAFVAGLSPASRFRRFHVGLRTLPPALLQKLTEIDHRSHVALVAQPGSDDDGDVEPPIVADARYVRALDDDVAEFAVAVADGWQRQGLGQQMLERLARHAARHGVRRLVGDVLVDNAPMIALVARLNGELQSRNDEPGVLLATFRT